VKTTRVLVAALLVIGALGAPAQASHEEPVSNDTVASALTITGLPYFHTTDTSQAVDRSDEDAAPERGCFEHSDYSVWYSLTPDSDMLVRLSTAGSEFDTVLEIFAGAAQELVDCDDDGGWEVDSRISLNAVAGETYLIRAAGYGGENGYLQFSAHEVIPMEASLSVADQGVVRLSNGRAIVSAVLECNQYGYADILFRAEQGTGPLAANGRRWISTECGEQVPLNVRINSRNGTFLPGQAEVEWSGFACSEYAYGWGVATAIDSDETVSTMDHDEDVDCTEFSGSKTVLLLPAE
jgi:hypothetical protein